MTGALSFSPVAGGLPADLDRDWFWRSTGDALDVDARDELVLDSTRDDSVALDWCVGVGDARRGPLRWSSPRTSMGTRAPAPGLEPSTAPSLGAASGRVSGLGVTRVRTLRREFSDSRAGRCCTG